MRPAKSTQAVQLLQRHFRARQGQLISGMKCQIDLGVSILAKKRPSCAHNLEYEHTCNLLWENGIEHLALFNLIFAAHIALYSTADGFGGVSVVGVQKREQRNCRFHEEKINTPS
jgi:hypothetical protein